MWTVPLLQPFCKCRGYEVVGMSVQTFDAKLPGEERFDSCCSISDLNDARRVCEKLGVPHFVVNAVDAFESSVIDNFVSEYVNGRTPNPCVHCNDHIKFDYLMERALDIGAEFVATGHYAKVRFDEISKRYAVARPVDENKDQSYYLFGLTQEQLSRTLFPLGELRKMQVRKLAEQYGLERVSKKPDSHEICFVGSAGYKKFIEDRVAPGLLGKMEFILPGGESISTREGVHAFTIGQKKGIPQDVQQVIAKLETKPGDLYVTKVDVKNERVYLGTDEDLLKRRFLVDRFNWMGALDFSKDQDVLVRIRSLSALAPGTARLYAGGQVEITCNEGQRAVTPGQAAVLYNDNQEVIGGGWIREVMDETPAAI